MLSASLKQKPQIISPGHYQIAGNSRSLLRNIFHIFTLALCDVLVLGSLYRVRILQNRIRKEEDN